MKKVYKFSLILNIILITGIVSVSALNTISSSGVLYSNEFSSTQTVEGALNELYSNLHNLLSKGNATSSDILVGKKAVVKGTEITGTINKFENQSKVIKTGDNIKLETGYYNNYQVYVNPSETILAVHASETCYNGGPNQTLISDYDYVSDLINYNNGVFTVKVAGSYTIKVSIMTHYTKETNTRVWIYINDVPVREIIGDDLRASTTYTGTLNVGDTIKAYSAGGGSLCNMPTSIIYLN